jgi:RHS repeat-associated protein
VTWPPQYDNVTDYTYAAQLDAERLTSANNSSDASSDANLTFDYEPAPPFALQQYSAPLNSVPTLFSIQRDATGTISSVSMPASGATIFTAAHDPAGRLTRITSGDYIATQILDTSISYDNDLGNRHRITHSTGLVGTFDYELHTSRLLEVSWVGNATPGGPSESVSENIVYEQPGERIDSIVREFGTFSFTHDAAYQLTGINFTGSPSLPQNLLNRTSSFDPAGNRVGDSVYGAGSFFANQLLSDSLYSYAFDVDGLGAMSLRENLASGAAETYTHRIDGLLTNYSNPSQSVIHSYDGLGRRIQRTSTPTGGSAASQGFVYLGDTNKVLIATRANGDPVVYLPGQDDNEYLGHTSLLSGPKAYITDHQSSVLNTDAAGSVRGFSPTGERLDPNPITNMASTEPLLPGWQGLPYMRESGDFLNGPRTYAPGRETFNESDPIGFWGGTTNFYASRNNSPLLYVDPTGLSTAVFNRASNTIRISSNDGQLSLDFPASNFTTRSYFPLEPGLYFRGPGSTKYDPNMSLEGTLRALSFGTSGFRIPIIAVGRIGLFIHAGRTVATPTQGCIRVSNEAIDFLQTLEKNGDPLESILVR